jgi:hypothetical protein
MRVMGTLRGLGRAGALLLLLLGQSGCFNPFAPRIASTAGRYKPPPEPNTAEGVIRLFEWSYNRRDVSRYKELFTADYRFYFALGDSAGNLFRDAPVDRETEVRMARNLFVGGGAKPPANSIVLNLDPTITPQDDSRVGKNPKWHREVVTSVYLSIRTDEDAWDIQGSARFFVVRGDSAMIPAELGFKPDSNRWYIDRWNDETLGSSPGLAARPGGPAITGSRAPAVPLTVTSIERVPWGTAPRPRMPGKLDLETFGLDITWGQLKAIYSR